MTYKTKIGDKVPEFIVHDHEGIEISSEDLIGSPFILYFYPKDDTPGCTIEACSFRDNMHRLDQLDTMVIGVSPDDADSHLNFMQKYRLNFTLLCDAKLELARKFDAIQMKEVNGQQVPSILRSTFVIDSSGIIQWIERPVNVEGHVDRVLEAVRKTIR